MTDEVLRKAILETLMDLLGGAPAWHERIADDILDRVKIVVDPISE